MMFYMLIYTVLVWYVSAVLSLWPQVYKSVCQVSTLFLLCFVIFPFFNCFYFGLDSLEDLHTLCFF